ncbi:hypothetical protein NHH03_05185 [Stieleria sp. TO1_6]|uniref:hypothetical protein n=1 Tax=Stieleria tagensis TaxID=2956795 RepID=UPI00209B8B58|nr:hypothetical protein [Stieleria tagensis]MCO8121123.1 hypothetical protein [Stieleria tagensis]
MSKQLALVFVGLIGCLMLTQQISADESQSKIAPTENPPQILVASSIDADEQLVLVSYHSIFIGFDGSSYNERLTQKVSLKAVKITSADGVQQSVDQARKTISENDTPILVTSYKKPLPKFYKTLFSPDTLHFAFPSKAPQWKPIQSPGAPVQ